MAANDQEADGLIKQGEKGKVVQKGQNFNQCMQSTWSRMFLFVGLVLVLLKFLDPGNQDSVIGIEVERKPVSEGGHLANTTEPQHADPAAKEEPQSDAKPVGLHLNPLPRFTREQLMDRRDLYANIHVPVDYQGENLASVQGLRNLLSQGRKDYWSALEQDYGEYAKRMFGGSGNYTIGRRAFKSPVNVGKYWDKRVKDYNSLGREHFIEKMKLKLVQAQVKFLESDATPDKTLTRFVHVHGGHSAGCGHGNLYRESYTAVMERALRPTLRRIGINYVGRNMGAGATSCADEVSLCSNAYFGYEMDLHSWDYGMTDGKLRFKQKIYAQRSAFRSQLPPLSDDINDIPSRPAMIGVHYNAHSCFSFSQVENKNMTVVFLDEGVRGMSLNRLPDSRVYTNQTDIDAMPPFVRNFRCGSSFEKGGACKNAKYNDTICGVRAHKAGWHPGNKMHALDGHLLALGVLDSMEEALVALAKLEPANESREDAKVRLTKLFWDINNAEQARYDSFHNNGDRGLDMQGWVTKKGDQMDAIWSDQLLKRPNFCHIPKLPSDQRYRGLLTQNFEKTTINIALEQRYEEGFLWDDCYKKEVEQTNYTVTNPEPRQDELVIVTHPRDKCDVPTYLDNRDFFYISSKHGTRGLTLPNDSEQQFYSEYDAKKASGWIIMCFSPCSHGKCGDTDVRPGNRKKKDGTGDLEILINGVKVTKYSETGGGCDFLRHDTDDESKDKLYTYTWTPNEDGKYEIKMQVVNSQPEYVGYTKIGAIILY